MKYFLDATPGPLVILMRHGQTALNDPKNPRLRAWKDVPLDPAGKIDVQLTANRLRKYKPGYAFSSDLMRDAETCQIVSGMLDIGAEQDFNARTWDMGRFEWQLLADVNGAVAELYARPWEYPPGSSESFNDFAARWQKFLDLKMDAAAKIDGWRPILIITHGKNIALAQSYIEGVEPAKATMPLPAGFAVINVNDDRSLSLNNVTKTEPVIEDA